MECLFCLSGNITNASYPRPTFFNNKIFSYRQCEDCGLIFIDPLPSRDDYDKMYAKSYHDEFYFKETTPDYTNWFGLFEKYGKEKRIIDYGCGDASFLKFFKQKGYDCTGVEYDPELVTLLRKANPGISFYTVEEFWGPGQQVKFNILFMGDVLEHLTAPAKFLNKLLEKIEPGGMIAAQGPVENNSNLALGSRKYLSGIKTKVKGNSTAAHVPYHIFFSNAENQEAVFKQTGMKTVYYKVFETNWPFPSRFTASPGTGLKYLIAKTSILLSKVLPGKMGNRFLYLGVKK